MDDSSRLALVPWKWKSSPPTMEPYGIGLGAGAVLASTGIHALDVTTAPPANPAAAMKSRRGSAPPQNVEGAFRWVAIGVGPRNLRPSSVRVLRPPPLPLA